MLTSVQQEFSDSQNVTADAASTNIIDLGATGTVLNAPAALVRDIGKGEPIPIYVRLDSAAGGTNPTLIVDVQVDTVENFASPTTVASSESLAGGAAGEEVYLNVYLPEDTNQRYLRLYYDVGGTSPDYTLSAGVVMAKSSSIIPGA
jgi:hypothetical protein